jgi:rhodanese-related sulfurtransferase
MISVYKKIFLLVLILQFNILTISGFLSSSMANTLGSDKVIGKSELFINAKEAQKGISQKNGDFIVDVRPLRNFETAHIPDSLNIPIFALKTKSFLKNKNIFIVSQGYNSEQLENECTNLVNSGFHIKIILGGLNSWKDEGGNIEGIPTAIESINKVSPLDVYLSDNKNDTLVINLSSNKTNRVDTLTSRSISVPYVNEKSFINNLTECLKNRHKDFMPVLFISEHGEHYEKVGAIVKMMEIKNVFYLDGGIEEYNKFLDDKSLMGKREQVTSSKNNQCGTCP